MIDPRIKLIVFHDDNGAVTDYSDNAADYLRDTFSMDLSSTEDYLYLGFHKEINATYIEIDTPNTVSCTLAAEYYDGTAWQSMEISDETKGMSRSGFITWERQGAQEVEINSTTAVYVRFRPSADNSVTVYKGINIVFSDDASLKREFYEVDDSGYLPSGQISQIMAHVSARTFILQKLRNLGYIKWDADLRRENITPWDLLDVFEIKEASTYLALSKIFFAVSDSTDDHYWQKYKEYENKFEESFGLARLSIDTDNDGVSDSAEQVGIIKPIRWVK